MNDSTEIRGFCSKKTFCIRELYRDIPKERPGAQSVRTSRRKSKILQIPVKVLRILPVLNVRPPQIPTSAELFSKSGLVIKTFQGQNDSKVMLLPKYLKNQGDSSARYEKILEKSNTGKSENRLTTKTSFNQHRQLCRSFLAKNAGTQAKTKEKLQTLQELLLNDENLTGWEAS